MAKSGVQTEAEVFAVLRDLLVPFASELTVKEDNERSYFLETKAHSYKGKPMFFAAVMRKSYVSFHLMPLYWNSRLLEQLSPELRTRMQGKSCFRFKTIDLDLFGELAQLTREGFNQYKAANLL